MAADIAIPEVVENSYMTKNTLQCTNLGGVCLTPKIHLSMQKNHKKTRKNLGKR